MSDYVDCASTLQPSYVDLCQITSTVQPIYVNLHRLCNKCTSIYVNVRRRCNQFTSMYVELRRRCNQFTSIYVRFTWIGVGLTSIYVDLRWIQVGLGFRWLRASSWSPCLGVLSMPVTAGLPGLTCFFWALAGCWLCFAFFCFTWPWRVCCLFALWLRPRAGFAFVALPWRSFLCRLLMGFVGFGHARARCLLASADCRLRLGCFCFAWP